ncbi:LysE family translocator [Pacificispira sp.]|uniref:LysE family translocator n=1 Tax=Pacificispira sp. TaxID=2888761 RepID=UPI003BAC029A
MLLPDLHTFMIFAAASLALYIAPGPDMILIASRSMGGGFRAGICANIGICIGITVHMLAAAFGLAALLAADPDLFQVLTWIGAAYLLYLGVKTILTARSGLAVEAKRPDTAAAMIRQGLFVNLLNPKIAVFFLAFLPQFADPSRGDPTLQILFLGALFNAGGFVFASGIALAFSRVGPWLRARPSVWRWQQILSGSVLVGLAVNLALPDRR